MIKRERPRFKRLSDGLLFMQRLRNDKRGNVLMITAALIIPIAGVIGSGVDISRAYVVKTRLQQACDAGVLGGRKIMTSAGVDTSVTAEVRKFVNYDFPQQFMNSTSFDINPSAGAGNAVNLTLATSTPTTLMNILGISQISVSVNCSARQDFVNTDIMLVLDTTLSMNCSPSDPGLTTLCTSEKSDAKIKALRAAVTSFYNALKPAQTTLEGQGLRLRYGIVPYASTVNVGALLTPNGWVNTTSNYRNCTTRSSAGSPSICNTAGTPYSVAHDAAFMSSWAGCIEERQTVSTITTSSGYTPPSGAYDLDISTVPSSTSTKWNVYDPAAQGSKGSPYSTALYSACPSRTQAIQTIPDVATLNTYMNGLVAGGYTYLDLGMLWGGRLLAQNGLWASNNPATYNGFPVNRDLILMTDGGIDPDLDHYSAYGVEKFDKRVTGNGADTTQNSSHLQRFRMMCNAVKGMNVNVWVIAFGSDLTSELVNCASQSSQAFRAANQADLVAQFTQIGQTIGALRLSQ
jgi:Flp pilus assembly protein TadG